MKTRTIKRLILLAGLIPVFHTAQAQSVKVTDASATRSGSLIDVALTIETPGGLDANSGITFTPVIRASNDSIELPSQTIAGRNRYYTLLRSRADSVPTVLAKKDQPAAYRTTVGYQNWMQHSTLAVRFVEKGCCGKPVRRYEENLTALDYTPRMFSAVYQYMRPVTDPDEPRVKTRSISGKACIDFRTNITEIDPDYSNNRRELAAIDATVDSVKLDRDITIDSIHIRGYASPEGSYANNTRLAKGRTAAVADYVGKLHSFEPGLIHCSYEPEDWDGLAAALSGMTFENKDEVLAIVTDTRLGPDAREAKFRESYPSIYTAVREMIYPRLRHSDYTIYYRVRSYTDPAEIVSIALTSPSKLSYNEICLASATLEPGSDNYAILWENAARLFPESTVAKVNAANCAMASGRLFTAQSLLLETDGDTPEVVYAQGNLAALQGDRAKAEELFTRAARMKVSDAPAALQRLKELPDWQ